MSKMHFGNGVIILFFKILSLPYRSTGQWMLEVSNGFIKSAHEIWPLLELLAKMSACLLELAKFLQLHTCWYFL